jgi:uncharacterized delta-60 repeat protein
MRKWILYLIVVSIMISVITGCSIFGGSSGSIFGRIGSGGGSGYSPAIGVLDTSFNGTGFVVHNNKTGSNSEEIGKSIYVDNTGSIYVTGYSNSGGNPDMVIWKYNSSGSLDSSFNSTGTTPGIVVHHNAAGGFAMDYGNSIYVDNTGNIYVTGSSMNRNGNYDMVIWKYNRDGSLDTSFNRTGFVVHDNAAGGNSHDYGYSIYVDNNGNIYVTGRSWNNNGNYDMVI